MIGRSAASVWSSGPFGSRRTRRRASSGARRAIGSSSAKRPSSYSIKAATVVSGFVIDAIRKIVSRSTGRFVARSRRPTTRRLHDASVPPHQSRGAGEGSGIYVGSKSVFDRILAETCHNNIEIIK